MSSTSTRRGRLRGVTLRQKSNGRIRAGELAEDDLVRKSVLEAPHKEKVVANHRISTARGLVSELPNNTAIKRARADMKAASPTEKVSRRNLMRPATS